MLVLVAFLLTSCGSSAPDGASRSTTPTFTPSPLAALENSTQVVTTQPPGSLQIVMTHGSFTPKGPQVSAGDANFYLVNPPSSSAPHQMTIINALGRVLASSDSVEVERAALFTVKGLEPGSYDFYCAIDDHRSEGMTGVLEVR